MGDSREVRTVVERPRADRDPNEPAAPETSPPLSLGAPAGRYEVGDEIARGGMGRVAEATDRMLGRTVAIKQILDHDDEAQRRFVREVKITARLEHPSIIPLYDAGADAGGRPFYIMRKVSGRALSDLLREQTGRERLALLPTVLAAADAVAHAHRRGIIHRDLKPHNILAGDLGETVVIDWGLAKVVDDDEPEPISHTPGASLQTRAGTSMGTPGYMAPEQIDGEPCTFHSDVYALGATLYHVITGKPPHEAPDATAVLALAALGPPQPLRELAPGTPDELVAIADRALAYDKTARYPDAAAFADDLRRFLTGQLVAAHRYSFADRVWRFVRRHRVAVIVSLLALAITATTIAIAFRDVVDARDRALDDKRQALAAKERETLRAHEASVANARMIAESNPIAAVELMQHLPEGTPLWKRARDVVAFARSRGVPWLLDGPKLPVDALAIDTTAFVAGYDGEVWRYDLAARTAERIRDAGTRVRIALDARLLVIAGEDLELRDIATGQATRIPVAARIVEVAARAGAIAWIDDANRAWWRRGDRSFELPLQLPAGFLALSPDGARLALGGFRGVEVFEFAGDAARRIASHAGSTYAVAWSPSGTRLGIAGEPGGYELDLATQTKRLVGRFTYRAAVYVGDDLYFSDTEGQPFRAGDSRAVVGRASFDVPRVARFRGGAAFGTNDGRVTLFNRATEVAIKVPGTPLAIAGSGESSLLAVAIPSRVLIYDAAPVLPRFVPTRPASFVLGGFFDDRHYLSTTDDDWTVYDVETGSIASFGRLAQSTWSSTAPGAYIITTNPREETVLARLDQPPQTIAGAGEHALAAGPDRVLVWRDRTLFEHAVASGTRTELLAAAAPITRVATRNRFIAAALGDGTLIRIELGKGRTEVSLAKPPSALAVDEAGVVYAAIDDTVTRWDGVRATRAATLPRPISHLGIESGRLVIAIDDKHATWRVDDPATRVYPRWVESSAMSTGSTGSRLAIVADRQGALSVYDLETDGHWPLPIAESHFDITPAGNRAVVGVAGGFVVIDLTMPQDEHAFAAWVRAATNLDVGRAGELVFPAPGSR